MNILDQIKEMAANSKVLYDELMAQIKALEEKEVDLTDYVKNTDIASEESAGIVKFGSPNETGIRPNNKGQISLVDATDYVITHPTSYGVAMTSKNIYKWFRTGITMNPIELTDEEKAAALAWLGLGDLVARLEALEAEVSPPLITFSFQPTKNSSWYELQAEEGMTWGEFIDSEYNIEVEGYKMGKASWGNDVVYLGNSTSVMPMDTGNPESLDNIIVAGKQYYSYI